MALRFVGKDPDSPNGDSPSVWDDGDSFVIQGWKVTDPGEIADLLRAAGQAAVPGHEALIRFPSGWRTSSRMADELPGHR